MRWRHIWAWARPYVSVGGAVVLEALFVWLGALGGLWTTFLLLPPIYLVVAILYSFEAQLPPWASRLLVRLAELWPPVSWLADLKKVSSANESLLEQLRDTVKRYGWETLVLSDAEIENEAARGRILTLPECCKLIVSGPRGPATAGVRDLTEVIPSARALELLHGERCGELTKAPWGARNGLVDELASILLQQPRFSRFVAGLGPTDKAEVALATLVAASKTFDLDLLDDELYRIDRLRQRIDRFRAFLDQAGLGPVASVSGSDLVGHLEAFWLRLPQDPSRLWMIDAPEVVLRELNRVAESISDKDLQVVSVGVFLAEWETGVVEPLKLAAHQVVERHRAGKSDKPLKMLYSYLWKKEEADAVALRDLATDWRGWYASALASLPVSKRPMVERRVVAVLQSGIWPTHRGALDLLGEVFSMGTHPPAGDLEEVRRQADELLGAGPWSRASSPEALASAVRGALDVPAVHEEVREVDAYLITFDERTGPVAQLLDCLMDPTDDQIAALERAGVHLKTHGHHKYRFGRYTKATRLGILPPGMPFHEFAEDFNADIETVLGNLKSLLPGLATLKKYVVPPPDVVLVEQDHFRDVVIECAMPGRGFKVVQPPLHGRLGTVTWLDEDARRGVLAYVPAPDYTGPDSFTYTCTTAGAAVAVHLLVHGAYGFSKVEITLDRIDLAHCRQIVLPAKIAGGRRPAISNVWTQIEPRLSTAERPRVKRMFDRVAGPGGCT